MNWGLIQVFVAWCKNLNRPLSLWWRCQTDKKLVFNTQRSFSKHVGHRMDECVPMTFVERFLVRFSLVKDLYE